jgi:DNA repair protein RadD
VHIRDPFRCAGILAEHIDGRTPIEEREAILVGLASGKVEVVVNCAVLTEGWDCPTASCLVLARSTKSIGLYRQMAGRVLRRHREKPTP